LAAAVVLWGSCISPGIVLEMQNLPPEKAAAGASAAPSRLALPRIYTLHPEAVLVDNLWITLPLAVDNFVA
jgi:hypothetical protein